MSVEPTPPSGSWVGEAIVKTLLGAVIAVLTACLISVFGWVFPSIRESSVDRSMRVSEVFRPAAPTAVEAALGIRGYVFVDVDPGDPLADGAPSSDAAGTRLTSSQQACAALAPSSPVSQAGEWDCAPWRPINRYMLAALIDTLRQRNVMFTIVDVELNAGGYPLPAEEHTALISALQAARSNALAVLPAVPLREPLPGDQMTIQLEPAPSGMPMAEALEIAAPAVPFTEDPVRHFADCYGVQTRDNSGKLQIASVPVRAAAALRGVKDVRGLCRPARVVRVPERLLFTLPALPVEPRSPGNHRTAGLWARYSPFYVRCRAIDVVSPESICNQPELYRGKVVLVGASARARGDRHTTPLGEMSGGEVILNAVRSTLLTSQAIKTSAIASIGHEMGTLAKGTLVWLVAFLTLAYLGQSGLRAGVKFALRVAVTIVAVGLATLVAVTGSFDPMGGPDRMNLLLPLVAAGLEQYVEFARNVVETLERFLRGALERIGRAVTSNRPGTRQ